MGKLNRLQVLALTAALLGAGACAHSPISANKPGNSSSDQSSSDQSRDRRPLPFHDGEGAESAVTDAYGKDPAYDPRHTELPFAASATGSLPAGALLTVQLKETLAGTDIGAKTKTKTATSSGTAFSAALEVPAEVNGKTVAARGTLVRGLVESARASVMNGNRGYLRLTLVSIHLSGQEVALRTSSLFAPGESEVGNPTVNTAYAPANVPSGVSPSVVYIRKGRLLTFRLSTPVFIPAVDPAQISKNSQPNSD